MLLAVDIGNTNVTTATVRDGRLGPSRRASTHPHLSPDEVEIAFASLLGLDGVSLDEVDDIVLASVVPALTEAVEAIARDRGLGLVVASVGTAPLPVRVERPSEVGADRLVNALAVARLYGTPAVVIDFGTATTFDCVASDGAYVGGAIAPGLELGLEALAARTAKLPRVELRTPERAIGRDTVSAMRAGTIFGYQALATGLLARIRVELAASAGVDPAAVVAVLTGGLSAAPWARAVEGVDALDPELTLKGLAILHAEVTGAARPAIAPASTAVVS